MGTPNECSAAMASCTRRMSRAEGRIPSSGEAAVSLPRWRTTARSAAPTQAIDANMDSTLMATRGSVSTTTPDCSTMAAWIGAWPLAEAGRAVEAALEGLEAGAVRFR